MLGLIGFIFLILIYFRSGLKRWTKRANRFWQHPFWLRLLRILNRYHCWLGSLAVALIVSHCLIKPTIKENFVLYLLLGVTVIIGLTGWAMEIKFIPDNWRHKFYYYHAQWLSGLIILLLLLLGHLLIN